MEALLEALNPEGVVGMVTLGTTKENVAVLDAVALTIHVPVPEQPLLHPAKVLPTAGTAFNVTLIPELNEAEQVFQQSIPLGEDVTVPDPALLTLTI